MQVHQKHADPRAEGRTRRHGRRRLRPETAAAPATPPHQLNAGHDGADRRKIDVVVTGAHRLAQIRDVGAAPTADARQHTLSPIRLLGQFTPAADPRRPLLRRPFRLVTLERPVTRRRRARVLRSLPRLANQSLKRLDPAGQFLNQRCLFKDDRILVGFAQRDRWKTIHPKDGFRTSPIAQHQNANHVSNYVSDGEAPPDARVLVTFDLSVVQLTNVALPSYAGE